MSLGRVSRQGPRFLLPGWGRRKHARMRTLTGLQPSGTLHVGNYFGAMRPAVQLQEEGEAYYFIADYHAMTTTHDPGELRANVGGVALDFLACGLDPEKAVFWRQSDIPEVCELA